MLANKIPFLAIGANPETQLKPQFQINPFEIKPPRHIFSLRLTV
jgi:hypothetical protein